jgi:hypothetical protein
MGCEETGTICVYVYYTSVLIPGDHLRIVICESELVFFVIYHLRIREAEFCVLASSVIWWRSLEFRRSA